MLSAPPAHHEHDSIRACVAALKQVSQRADLFLMHGNRDFLIGELFAKASGVTLLPDPSVLSQGTHRWLLSHGDTWCLADQDYLRFRETVRQPAWESRFLAQPLPEREAIARQMREQSQQHQQAIQHQGDTFADVDNALAADWLQKTGCRQLIHGHTHRPGVHPLGQGQERLVLSDWDARAHPPRLEVLTLKPDGQLERRPIKP